MSLHAVTPLQLVRYVKKKVSVTENTAYVSPLRSYVLVRFIQQFDGAIANYVPSHNYIIHRSDFGLVLFCYKRLTS